MPDGFPFEFETEGFREWTELAVKEVERDMARKVLRALALDFIRRVIERTPVDKGRARGGWASFAIAQGRKPKIGGSEPAETAAGIAEGSFREGGFGADDQFIEIINGVSYIVLLEFGSSGKAPAGMMRITFREMQMSGKVGKEMKAQLEKTFTQVNRRLRVQRMGTRSRGFLALGR